MPRKKLIRQSNYPYHIVTRTNNKQWFPLPMYQVWNLCKEAILYAQEKCSVEINCLVLMSNHYHLIITTPDENIDTFMRFFNGRFSILIAKSSGLLNQKFSNRYRWSVIESDDYLRNVYRYIYQNPIRAGIVETCGDYPYSSLYFTSFEAQKFNFKPHFHYAQQFSFFERRFGSNTLGVLRNALKHPVFKVAKKASQFEKQELVRGHQSQTS